MKPTTIYALDPGTFNTAIIKVVNGLIKHKAIMPNNELLLTMRMGSFRDCLVAIESVASYGMAVGKETFETVEWCGRFREAADANLGVVMKVYRKDVKLHLCGTVRAKDTNIMQSLKDKWGEVGTVKNPGPLYGIKSHLWAALAVADYAIEKYNPAG